MGSQKYCVKWTNRFEHYHKTFLDLIDSETFCDVTLVSEGKLFKAHQFLLSVCSSYFKDIFQGLQVTQHPVIVLRGVTSQEIKCLLDYIYKGETIVPHNLMPRFLETCESLHIQGFCHGETQNSESMNSQETVSSSGSDSQKVAIDDDINSLSATRSKVQKGAYNGFTKRKRNINKYKGCIKSKKAKCKNTECVSDRIESEDHQNLSHTQLNSEISAVDNITERDVLDSPPNSPQSIIFSLSRNLNDVHKEAQMSDSILILSEKSANVLEISDEEQSDKSTSQTDKVTAINSNDPKSVFDATLSDDSIDEFRLAISPDIPADVQSDETNESEIIIRRRCINRLPNVSSNNTNDKNNMPTLQQRNFDQYNADFVYEDPFLVTGILRAVVEENLEKVKTLVVEGKSANINDNHGNTPLHVAVIRNLPEIVDYLLTVETVLVNSRNFYGETSLFLAVKRGHLHLAEKLIKANGNVNLSNFEDITPLHISVKYPKITHLLLRNGANVNAIDYSGETPLHEAVNEGFVETVCMLLYYNADANVKCDNNITPFMKSIILDNLELQEILLDYVDDFNTTTKDCMTILNLALTHTCPYVKEIIDRGADINYEHIFFNAFLMCLQVPDVNKFSLIWQHFKYQEVYGAATYLEALIHHLDNTEFYQFLRIIVDSNNLTPIFKNFDFTPFDVFLNRETVNKYAWFQITSELICLYLSEGNILDCHIIYQLYDLFGYNELLYICLHMDIEDTTTTVMSMAIVFFKTKLSISYFKSLLSKRCRSTNISVKQFLPYIRIAEISGINCIEENKIDYEAFGKVPSLLEISRNVSRDYLVERFGLYTSKQYYLFVQNLQISTIFKDILTFKKPVYAIKP